MPNCFMLRCKVTDKPVNLQEVDDAMRVHFNAEPSATHWYRGWYDLIGFGFALGRTADELRAMFDDQPDLIQILDWITKHYTPDAWAER